MIVMIVASIGSQRSALIEQGPRLLLACLLLHGGGFLLGHLIPRLLGEPVPVRSTISIEVGMQNSGLAVVWPAAAGSPARSPRCRGQSQR